MTRDVPPEVVERFATMTPLVREHELNALLTAAVPAEFLTATLDYRARLMTALRVAGVYLPLRHGMPR